MNLDDLHKKLVLAARSQPVSDRVPYAFEKRVMAHISARLAMDRWNAWGNGLWRAAVSCVAVAIVCGGISLFTPPATDTASNDLSQDLENTLLASADQSDTTP